MNGEEILALDDRPMETVKVPEWNDEVIHIRVMGAVERAKHETSLIESKDLTLDEKMIKIKVNAVLLCACDAEGNRLFSDDQFDALAEKNADAIDRLYDVINRINMITQAEVVEEKKD